MIILNWATGKRQADIVKIVVVAIKQVVLDGSLDNCRSQV